MEFNQELIKQFCENNNILRLSFFGSVLTENFTDESDIDILVEFMGNCKPGLLGMARLERELTELLGRKVDLRTPEELSRYFRADIVKEAEMMYGPGG